MKFISVVDVPKPDTSESEARWIDENTVEFSIHFRAIQTYWDDCANLRRRVERYRNTILALIVIALGEDKPLPDDSLFLSIALEPEGKESLSILRVHARGKIAVNR